VGDQRLNDGSLAVEVEVGPLLAERGSVVPDKWLSRPWALGQSALDDVAGLGPL
jgi:hypothetical protein